MIESTQARRTDEQRIDSIIAALRTAYPDAASFAVSSSDQGSGGYWITDVTLADGQVVDISVNPELDEELWEDATWLRWGAFGDNNSESAFDVDMTTRKIIRKGQQ